MHVFIEKSRFSTHKTCANCGLGELYATENNVACAPVSSAPAMNLASPSKKAVTSEEAKKLATELRRKCHTGNGCCYCAQCPSCRPPSEATFAALIDLCLKEERRAVWKEIEQALRCLSPVAVSRELHDRKTHGPTCDEGIVAGLLAALDKVRSLAAGEEL